jgi:surfeit locus 1 family protein
MKAGRRLWPVVAASLAGIILLCALGVWQVQRLHWKEGLLAAIAQRQSAPAVPLSEALDRASADIEFLKVKARGHYLQGNAKLLIAVYDGSPGWEVITPFVTDDHVLVLVDRGVIPDGLRAEALGAAGDPAGEVAIEGLLSGHRGGRGTFSPDNDVKSSKWYWWDVAAMLAATPVPQGVVAFPAVLHLQPGAASTAFPRPQALAANLANNHMQYAITWFSLALVLAVIAGLYVRGQMKKPGA